MASLPLLDIPACRRAPTFSPFLLAAIAATIGFIASAAVTSSLYTAPKVTQTLTPPALLNQPRALPLSAVAPRYGATGVAQPVAVSAALPQPAASAWAASWTNISVAVAAFMAVVFGSAKVMAMFPLSGMRGTLDPFLDSIENKDVRQSAQQIAKQMIDAEGNGDIEQLLQSRTVMAAAMLMVSFEAVRKAARVQLACGSITVHSFVDTILVHSVPPQMSDDGFIGFSVFDVVEGRFWRQPELWDAVPLLKTLYECEQHIGYDLCDVLTGLLDRYAGCVSYYSLENRPDIWTEVEHKTICYLAKYCFDASVPYYGGETN